MGVTPAGISLRLMGHAKQQSFMTLLLIVFRISRLLLSQAEADKTKKDRTF